MFLLSFSIKRARKGTRTYGNPQFEEILFQLIIVKNLATFLCLDYIIILKYKSNSFYFHFLSKEFFCFTVFTRFYIYFYACIYWLHEVKIRLNLIQFKSNN